MKKLFACLSLLAVVACFAPLTQAQDVLFCNATQCSYKIVGRTTTNISTPCTGGVLQTFNAFIPPGCSFTLPVGPTATVKGMRVYDAGGIWTVVSFYNCNGIPSVTAGAIECNGDPVTVNFVQADLVEITN